MRKIILSGGFRKHGGYCKTPAWIRPRN
jgi:hypothetical protein